MFTNLSSRLKSSNSFYRGGAFALVCGLMGGMAAADTQTLDLDLKDFSGIHASAGVTVHVSQSDTFSVSVEVENGSLDNVEAEVSHGDLHLSRKSTGWFGGGNRARIRYTVTLPVLDELDVSSGVSLRAEGITANALELGASSGASLRVDGSCDTVEIDASSGSSVNAADMECVNASVDASSGASVSAFASAVASGDGSSGSSIHIEGGATDRTVDKSSGASVSIS